MTLNHYLKKAILSAFMCVCMAAASAQTAYFEPLNTSRMRVDASMTRHIKKLSFYTLKQADLRNYLAKAPLEFTNSAPALALQMPLPNGKTETFLMVESPILAPAIAAQHPDIKTYSGKAANDPSHTIRISFTSQGFNAIILGVDNDAAYYDKVNTNPKDQVYRVYFARDAERPKPAKAFGQNNKCGTVEKLITLPTDKANKGGRKAAGANDVGTSLRTFRLAIAADGEFTQQAVYGGDVNAAFAGLVGYVNRVNAVYRRELSVALQLVSDVSAVYSNTATDPYTNNDQGTMLDENQTNLDNLIGNAGYDIGHVLGYVGGSGGGIASRPSVCDDASKAQGVSGVGDGSFAPVFDDQLVAHEMGHQFGMTHSYNSIVPVCTTRAPDTSVEPGAGATIMSYGFTCDETPNDDNYEQPQYQPFLNFHTANYDQAVNYISTLSCFTTTSMGNAIPVIDQITASMTIPKSTPFSLSGVASDANTGDVLSYSWEGTNIGTETPTASTLLDPTKAPFFRSYDPVSTGVRTFPRLMAILDGSNTARGDKLPSVGVVTTHRLTVRDNAGGVTYGEVSVTIDGNSGPFLETTNLAGSYPGNSSQTITWDVANTTSAPVNSPNVDILLSTDGGLTFPTVLVANTPNDGSEAVTLPAVLTSTARIKVASSNNIFFDISNTDFSITAPVVADLTPLFYARPAIVYGTAPITLVVDVIESAQNQTNGLITVRVTRDPTFTISFPNSATTVGGRPVQNSQWSFDDSNSGYYMLTTMSVIGSGNILSIGLTGTLTPGATMGSLSISALIVGGSGGEVNMINNWDADKIDYFQQ